MIFGRILKKIALCWKITNNCERFEEIADSLKYLGAHIAGFSAWLRELPNYVPIQEVR